MSALARIAPWCMVAAALFCADVASAQREAADSRPNEKKGGPAAREVGALAASLTKAFNAHDAKAMASYWQEDGVHASASTGVRLEGRQALSAAYRKLFAEDPKCQLALRVHSVRKLADGVVSADCSSAIRHTDGQITRSKLNAILVRRDGDWWIAQVQETDLPAVENAADRLAGLDGLVGHWADHAEGTQVSNDFVWSHNARFLTRQFQQFRGGELVRGGTQMFGWDPVERKIRCWVFLDDGSFGEGVCTSEGQNKWVTKLALTLADGRSGALTQVIERVGPDQLAIQTIDRALEGAPQPNGNVVTLERQPEPVEAGAFGGETGGFGGGFGGGGGGGFF